MARVLSDHNSKIGVKIRIVAGDRIRAVRGFCAYLWAKRSKIERTALGMGRQRDDSLAVLPHRAGTKALLKNSLHFVFGHLPASIGERALAGPGALGNGQRVRFRWRSWLEVLGDHNSKI